MVEIRLKSLRVGRVEEGQVIHLIDRPNPTWSVARVLWARKNAATHSAETRAASALSGLSSEWVQKLRHLVGP